MLKKETSINKEKIIIWPSLVKIDERLFDDKKPPEEMMVIDKLREWKVLISKIFKIKKIDKVIQEYKIKILIVCFRTSLLLNDKKFVRDFFRLSS